jgi:hypothetical protein
MCFQLLSMDIFATAHMSLLRQLATKQLLHQGTRSLTVEINFDDPRWRLKERATTLFQRHGQKLGYDYAEAERMVKYVIETKEGPHGPSNEGSIRSEGTEGHG